MVKEAGIKRVNQKIQKILDDINHQEDFMTPQRALITFEHPFAAYLAINMTKKKQLGDKKLTVCRQPVTLDKIGYPSDMQYENFLTNKERYRNILFAFIALGIWAFLFMYGIYVLQQIVQNQTILFLSMDQNKDIRDYYAGDTQLFENFAEHDYKRIERAKYDISSFVSGLKLIVLDVK